MVLFLLRFTRGVTATYSLPYKPGGAFSDYTEPQLYPLIP